MAGARLLGLEWRSGDGQEGVARKAVTTDETKDNTIAATNVA
jgi:hypothetical protein